MSETENTPIISISPEPSPDELAAIVAAVTSALWPVDTPAPATRPGISAWVRQGRREGVAPFERRDGR